MNTINKVILIGNLGNDPQVKYMPNGNAVANMSIATTESWKDKATGERIAKTEWHRIVLYRRLAEIVGEYLKKGAKVYIEGRLQTRQWEDKDGNKRYTTEIVANMMKMLGNIEKIASQPMPAEIPEPLLNDNCKKTVDYLKQGTEKDFDFGDEIPF